MYVYIQCIPTRHLFSLIFRRRCLVCTSLSPFFFPFSWLMLLLLWCCLRHSVPTTWLRLPLLSVLLARIDSDEDDATLVCSHLVPRHHVVPSFYLYSPFPFCHLVYEKKKDEEEHCCPSLLGCSLIVFISQSTRLLWSSNSLLLRDSLASLAASAGLFFSLSIYQQRLYSVQSESGHRI